MELIDVVHSDKPCRTDFKNAVQQYLCVRYNQLYQARPFSSQLSDLGAVLQGVPQRRAFGPKAIHSLIQAPSHLPVRAECIANKPNLKSVTRDSAIRNDTPDHTMR